MNNASHAFIEVPPALPLHERALFIGRLISVYKGRHESTCLHEGCDCYKISTLGEWESQMEEKLLEDLSYREKLTILFTDGEHMNSPSLAVA